MTVGPQVEAVLSIKSASECAVKKLNKNSELLGVTLVYRPT